MEFISEGYGFEFIKTQLKDKALRACRSAFSGQAPNFLSPELRPQRRYLSTGVPAGTRATRLAEVCHE